MFASRDSHEGGLEKATDGVRDLLPGVPGHEELAFTCAESVQCEV